MRRPALSRVGCVVVCGLLLATAPDRARADAPETAAIALGFLHSCALSAGGGVNCWGFNDYGQLGEGSTAGSAQPVGVSGLQSGVVGIDAGGAGHTCAVLASGSVRCWGRNRFGQVGDGTTTHRLTPVAVNGIDDAVAVTTGGDHVCVITMSGAAECRGNNDRGQLGDGTHQDSTAPVPVQGLGSGVTALSAGGDHTCAIRSGTVLCWGANGRGQNGDGTLADTSTPTPVLGLDHGFVGVSAGGAANGCALANDGTVRCWGSNADGQLGDGSHDDSTVPVAVAGLSGATDVEVGGGGHACALTAGQTAVCWGLNSYGELGDGSLVSSSSPVDVGLPHPVSALATGGQHTCAVAAGNVWCWGRNDKGQTGRNTVSTAEPDPTRVTFPAPEVVVTMNLTTGGGFPTGLHNWFLHQPVEGMVEASSASPITALDCTESANLAPPQVAALTDVTGLHTVQATGGFEATAEGTTTITCTAINQDGATSSTRLETVAIDTTAPALTARVKPRTTANTGWYTARTGRPQVIWTCADPLPGSDLPPKPCPGVVVDEGTEQLIRLDLSDLAGNITSGSAGPLNVDVTPPAIECLPASFPLGKPNAKVKGAVTDATSGPRKATVRKTVAATAPGDYTASLQAIDVAGNKATVACPYHVG